jgi:hypothetical protein
VIVNMHGRTTIKNNNNSYKNGKDHPRTGHEGLYFFFNFGARGGGWSTPLSGRFTPGKDPIPIV